MRYSNSMDLLFPIPRHNEIDNNLADIICKEAEAKHGKGGDQQ